MPKLRTPISLDIAGAALDQGHYPFEDRWTRRPKLNASADLNGTFDDAEAEALAFANKDWELSGTNAADAGATFATIGGVTLTTTTTANDQIIVGGHTDTGVSPLANIDWSTGHGICFYQKIYTGTSLADSVIIAGFKKTNTPVIATDTDQAFFRIEDGALSCVASNAGVDETIATGVTLGASSVYGLYVVVSPNDRKATFFLQTPGFVWKELGQSEALAEDVDLLPFIGIQTTAASAKSVTLLQTALGKKLIA